MKAMKWRAIVMPAVAVAILALAASWSRAEEAAKPAPAPEGAAPAATAPAAEGAAAAETPRARTTAELVDEWLEKAKTPVPWLKLGSDLRLRTVYQNNNVVTRQDAAGHERFWQRYRWRFWGSVAPPELKDFDFNFRIVYEPRYFHKPEPNIRWALDDILFDNLNFRLRNIGGLPITLTAGRQDITMGNGWLIFDGTPLDGSRTIYFDAFRVTLDATKDLDTTFDFIYLDNDGSGDGWIKPMRDQDTNTAEQDERGFILYATNKSIKNVQLDGYYIYKRDLPEAFNRPAHLHTFGSRAVLDMTEHWQYRAEFALQYGRRMNADVQAGAFNSRVAYNFKDRQENTLFGAYEFLSGDDPGTDEWERFDPLWGRWPQWSELYFYTMTPENGRPGEISNLHRLGFGHVFKPAKPLEVQTVYHLLFADENAQQVNRALFSENGYFRGQLLQAVMRYKFNKHVSGHLIGEFFFPGNFYENFNNDPAAFLRYELVFTW